MALLQQPNVTLLLLKAYIVAPFTAKWGDTAREQLERGWNSGWVPQRSPLCIRIFRCAWAMIVLSCVCLELGTETVAFNHCSFCNKTGGSQASMCERNSFSHQSRQYDFFYLVAQEKLPVRIPQQMGFRVFVIGRNLMSPRAVRQPRYDSLQ